MPSWTIALLFGIALPAGFHALPPPWLLLAGLLLTILARITLRHAATAWLLALMVGLCWGIGYGYKVTASLLQPALEGETLRLTGRIAGLIEEGQAFGRPVQRFRLQVDDCELINGDVCATTPRLVQLSWYDEQTLATDQRWRLEVRLKRPHGFANPGGFDYESWLVAQGVSATGSVRAAGEQRLLAEPRRWHPRHWRARARAALSDRLATLPTRPLLLALLVGDGGSLSNEQWQLFRSTGTVHLFVVSGLHIALSGGLVLMFAAMWRRLPRSGGSRGHYLAGWLPALVVATLYAVLAGFGLPVQRALLMFAAAGAALVGWRERRGADAWLGALSLVLIYDPLAVLQAGFWFSFLAVAAILAALAGRGVAGERNEHRAAPSRQWRARNTARRWWQVQWATFAVTAPLLLGLMGSLPWLSLVANVMAIPLVSLLTLPLALLAVGLDLATTVLDVVVPAADLAWRAVDATLQLLLRFLALLAEQGAGWQWRPIGMSGAAMVCAAAASALAMLPRPMPGRWLLPVLLLPALFPVVERPAHGEAWVRVLDVGQGLSVLVQTRHHDLLYDTGPAFGSGTTVAELAVMPALRRLGVSRLDALMISHNDNDHAAGWRTLVAGLPITRVLSGETIGYAGEHRCNAGQQWQWDGVSFRVLHPRWVSARGNNNSCVLWIRAGSGTALLPGDIEQVIEGQLIWDKALPRADLVLAPHHGSRSSSSAAFIAAARPRHVVFAAGYRNAFGHPAATVLDRYREAGAASMNTADGGMLTYSLSAEGTQLSEVWRRHHRRYWQLPSP